jgi:S1-C subfamily serine protease
MKATGAGWFTAGVIALVSALVPCLTDAAEGPFVVNCHDKTRGTVQETLSGDCHGSVVSNEVAAAIKAERRAYIQGVLSKPGGSKVQGKRLAGSGSGFFVAADGSVITNHHVIDGCASVSISPTFGEMVLATVVATDAEADLALLRADLVPQGVAGLAVDESTASQRPAFLIGYPNMGLITIEPILTPVEVLRWQEDASQRPAIVIRGDVRQGNSGGPLLGGDGSVIGVVFAKVNAVKVYETTGETVRDIAMAIPGKVLRRFLDAQGVGYRVTPGRPPQPESQLLTDARPFVVQIGCWK